MKKFCKKLWKRFVDWRLNMREMPAYRVFERGARVALIGGLVTAVSFFTGGAAWGVPLLKASLAAGVLSGLDKFKNVLRKSGEFSKFFSKQ